jgi:hypothetical protein
MGFTLSQVVPWGRSFEEYARMFRLRAAESRMSILGCGDGPASFNGGMRRLGHRVVSVDPIYRFSPGEIARRIDATFGQVMEQLEANQADYVWSGIPSPKALGQIRMSAMGEFLADFREGRKEGRYVCGALPVLPFAAHSFDLALCSHFLFLYAAHYDAAFHLKAMLEMLRVAREVRVFPLLTLDGRPSPHVSAVLEGLRRRGHVCRIEAVDYEFQRGGNRMLRVS